MDLKTTPSTPLNASDGYRQLVQQISDTYTQGRVQAVQAVNAQLVQTYWQVGRHIVEFEQAGQVRAEYGKVLIDTLAADLGLRHGKGFSRSNLIRFRQFYLTYPGPAEKSATPSHQLTWSHIVELLTIDDHATYDMSSQLTVQRYQLHLPNREALRLELERALREAQA